MDNAMKAIMIGVGLFITIAVVSAVLIIMGMGNSMINNSTEKLTGLEGQMENELYNKYDDRQVSGSQVLGTVKQYADTNNIGIVIFNDPKGGTPVYTGGGWITGSIPAKYDTKLTSIDYEFSGDSVKVNKFTGKGLKQGEKPPTSIFSKTEQTSYYISANAQYQAFCIKQNSKLIGLVFYILPY